ncbi:YjcZ family sporulation protein [Bacillus sp. 123MFChir2]
MSDSVMAPFWAYTHTKRNGEVEFIMNQQLILWLVLFILLVIVGIICL